MSSPSTSQRQAAEHMLRRIRGDTHGGFGVLVTDSPIMRRIPHRRAVTREKEQKRLGDVASAVVEQLLSAGTAESARAVARAAGLADSIVVTETDEEWVRAVCERFGDGDNAWAATFVTGRVMSVYFWHDPSHPRIR
jgi:hypothetical protein